MAIDMATDPRVRPTVAGENVEAPELLLERAATCRFLHDLFRVPTPEQWTWLGSGAARRAWRILRDRHGSELPKTLPRPRSFERYHAEYLNTFDVGLPAPPCPLTASHWNSANPVAGVLHEHILFYRQFGLQLRPESLETADHLRHQLEFLQHLSLMEYRARVSGEKEAAAQIAAAYGDFLGRQFTWPRTAAEKAALKAVPVWARHFVRLLAESFRMQR